MDSARTVVPAKVYVHLADVGTTAPADATVALTGWTNVGYTTPDSISFSTSPEFETMPTAQSNYPVRRFQTSEEASVNADLLEWSGENFMAVFGGGSVTEVSAGPPAQYKFSPPKVGERVEKAALVEVIDGGKHYRYVFPRVQQVEGVEQELQKGSQSTLSLRLAVLGDDSTDPFYLLTDASAFAPAP